MNREVGGILGKMQRHILWMVPDNKPRKQNAKIHGL
jgi:hypothetical protein